MLRSTKELTGYTIVATDDEVGRCHDFLIDDKTWTVRYMVADTGKWLPGRKVLISPIALGDPIWEARRFPVLMSRAEIEASPDLDEEAPVSRQWEIWYHQHHGWPYYWGQGNLWAASAAPGTLYAGHEELGDAGPELENPHLHSLDEVTGYRIDASDGEIGRLQDLIIDDATWNIRYAVVDTRAFLPGKTVLVPLAALDEVRWDDRSLAIDLTQAQIKNLPEYDPNAPVNLELEERHYDYQGRPRD